MIVLTLEPGEAEKLAEGAPTLQRRYGMPIDPAPYARAVVLGAGLPRGRRGAACTRPEPSDLLLRRLRVRRDARRPARRPGADRARPRDDAGLDPAQLARVVRDAEVEAALQADIAAARGPARRRARSTTSSAGPARSAATRRRATRSSGPTRRAGASLPGLQPGRGLRGGDREPRARARAPRAKPASVERAARVGGRAARHQRGDRDHGAQRADRPHDAGPRGGRARRRRRLLLDAAGRVGGLAADRQALLAARAGAGAQRPADPRRHRHRVVVANQRSRSRARWPRRSSSVERGAAERLLHRQVAGPPLAREERVRQVLAVEARRVDRLLQVQPWWTWRRNACSAHWSCRSPPGVPNARYGSPSRSASAGVSVVRGRLPGARAFGCVRGRARTSGRAPRPGSRGPARPASPDSQPPLGVAETMLPCRSITSRWQVSPRVSARYCAAAAPGVVVHRSRRPSPSPRARSTVEPAARSASRPAVAGDRPGTQVERRLVADQPAPLGVVGLRQQRRRAARRRTPGRRRTPRGRRTRASRTPGTVCTNSGPSGSIAARSKPGSSASCCRSTGLCAHGPGLQTV